MRRTHPYHARLTATPEPASGGAAAALDGPITAPKVETGGGGGSGEVDIANYTPPAVSIDDFLDGAPTKKEEPAKKEQPAKKEEPAKKEDAPAKKELAPDAPAAQLRSRLKELETELQTKTSDLQKQLEAARSDKRVEELTRKIQETEGREATARKEREEIERKLLVHNPLVSKKLAELRESYNREWSETMEVVPSLKPVFRQLLDEFADLPRGKEDYPDRLSAFKKKLREQFEDDQPAVFDALRKGLKFREDHSRMADEIQRDAANIEFTERRSAWEKESGEFEKEYPNFFEPPADAADKDPLNARLFMKRFESGLPPEEIQKVDGNIKTFLNRLLYGAQPRQRSDFPELDDAAAVAEIKRIDSLVAEDRQKAKQLLPLALKFLMYARPLIAQVIKDRDVADKKRKAAPPDPTRTPGSEGGVGSDPADVANYNPPPIPGLEAFQG